MTSNPELAALSAEERARRLRTAQAKARSHWLTRLALVIGAVGVFVSVTLGEWTGHSSLGMTGAGVFALIYALVQASVSYRCMREIDRV